MVTDLHARGQLTQRFVRRHALDLHPILSPVPVLRVEQARVQTRFVAE
jgi:hypothetical protein